MASRDRIVEFCNKTLKLKDNADFGPMGLQFPGGEEVNGIACAVSVNLDVIKQAQNKGANLLIVHHGLFWNNESRLDAPWNARVEALEAANMTLLAYHLALDVHPKMGNNILLARNLGLSKLHRWGDYGYSGEYKTPLDPGEFYLHATNKLDITYGLHVRNFCFSEEYKVSKVAVVAGGAAHYIIDAKRDGFDTFVTGEPSEPSFNLAKDLEMNFFAFGHDKTERDGVKALTRTVSRKFNVPWSFIAQDNPV